MSEEKPPELEADSASTNTPPETAAEVSGQASPEEVLAIFRQAVDQSGVEGPLPNMILNLVGSALSQARQNGTLNERTAASGASTSPPSAEDGNTVAQTAEETGKAAAAQAAEAVGATSAEEPNVVDLEQEREQRAPREPSEFEKTLQSNLTAAFQDYLAEHVVDTSADQPEVNVDAQFLQNHGPAMLASAFSAFTRTIVPEEIKVEVPAGEGEEKKVALKLDLSGLLGNLTLNPTSKNTDTDA